MENEKKNSSVDQVGCNTAKKKRAGGNPSNKTR
jgi:hypothetical protein